MKILATTSIRADYDLMSELYQLLHADGEVDFRVLVSGGHLAKRYGYSLQQIEQDGFPILAKIETLLESDTPQAQVKTASLLMQSAVDSIAEFNPDLMLYVGDREDVIIYAMIASFLQIPAIHFWSGDHASDGNVDNLVRHAASKFANVHFVSLEQHRQRLLAIGEPAHRIHYVGNMALDRFVNQPAISQHDLLAKLNLSPDFAPYALCIFHPLPVEREAYPDNLALIIRTLLEKDISVLMSAPNTDPGNQAGFRTIEQFKSHPKVHYYQNLDRATFISLYKNAQFIIGNSSSGIVEAASIPIPAINVGLRQRDRFCGDNVIFCDAEQYAIADAIETVTSERFLQGIKNMKNPYGDGHSASTAYQLIKQLNFQDLQLKIEDPLTLKEE